MRTAYRYLSFAICALVGVQAASHAWASAGVIAFLSQGGTLDLTNMDGPPPFPEALGILIHGLNGMYVIPALALALLGVAFAARIPGGTARAGLVLGLVALQVTLGFLGHGVTALAFLHGLNALVLFAAALVAGLAASRTAARQMATSAAPVGSVH